MVGWWVLSVLLVGGPASAEDYSVKLVKTDEARVDVFVGNQLFASYHYGLGFHKPIFHPLYSPAGNIITRRYPMELGVPGEKHDHWHHEGMSFTYGNVNGIDFWAKREASGRAETGESGKIRHTGFSRLEGGRKGRLETTADWIAPDGKVLLKQRTEAVFSGAPQSRLIDLTITLTAQEEKVVFGDTKEGMFGIRVTPDLQEDHTGAYLNAEASEREAGVWGKRSPWVALRGKVKDEEITLVIFNHPGSTGYPTYWHARGYGLFAVNPFGRKDFEKGAEPLNYTLMPGQSAVFRYRVLVQSAELSLDQLEREFRQFADQ